MLSLRKNRKKLSALLSVYLSAMTFQKRFRISMYYVLVLCGCYSNELLLLRHGHICPLVSCVLKQRDITVVIFKLPGINRTIKWIIFSLVGVMLFFIGTYLLHHHIIAYKKSPRMLSPLTTCWG